MKEIIATITAFFSSLVFMLTGNTFNLKPTVTPTPTPIVEITSGDTGSYFLKTNSKTLDTGKDFEVNIYLKTPNLNITSGSVRLIYHFENQPLIEFKDQEKNKEGVQIKVNPLLISNNFLFPINKIETDLVQKQTFIDLAFLTTDPQGYVPNEDLYLGTLTFQGLKSKSNIDLNFDPTQTTIQNKKGEQLIMNLKNESYIIN